jgi:phospholipid/cholesterol/gamma-HCH transport system ATP-binding protein
VINLEEVGKQFSGKWIFRDLTFSVSRGESVVLIGPSGSGKIVLLKIIAGLLNADAGSVHLESTNIGMLFQKNALFDSLSVEDNLLFPLRERLRITGSEARDRATSLLRAVNLPGTESLFPNELSGGMQKRLGIARALIVEPDILLYDEPTAGLDPITSRLIADMIGDLRKKRGTTLVTVTNDIQRAYQLGDQIFLLNRGELILGGTPEQTRATRIPKLKFFISGGISR